VPAPNEPSLSLPLFIGQLVRVRPGTRDPDFPTLSLAGWTGTIRERDGATPPMCLVEWDKATLARIPADILEQSERTDLEIQSIWLNSTALETVGGAVERQDDPLVRVRSALGLDADAPIPGPTPEALQAYHGYLVTQLPLPLEAVVAEVRGPKAGPGLAVTVRRVLPADHDVPGCGLLAEVESEGRTALLPLAALEGRAGPVQDLRDYALWFWSTRKLDPVPKAVESVPDPWAVWRSLGLATIYAAGAGAALGAVVAAVPYALHALVSGALILGIAGYLTGSRTSRLFRATSQVASVPALASFLGLLVGGLSGGILGTLGAAVLGTVPGCIAGSLLSRALEALGRRWLSPMTWVALGGFLGAAILALLTDQDLALEGATAGALLGAGAGLLLVLLALVGTALSARRTG
jgi:hypothetical protein